jgi:hypothetical protein
MVGRIGVDEFEISNREVSAGFVELTLALNGGPPFTMTLTDEDVRDLGTNLLLYYAMQEHVPTSIKWGESVVTNELG